VNCGQADSRTSLRTTLCPQENLVNNHKDRLVEAAGVEAAGKRLVPRKHCKTSRPPTSAQFRKLLVFEVGRAGAWFSGHALYVRRRVSLQLMAAGRDAAKTAKLHRPLTCAGGSRLEHRPSKPQHSSEAASGCDALPALSRETGCFARKTQLTAASAASARKPLTTTHVVVSCAVGGCI
jgi:hypothetical protein